MKKNLTAKHLSLLLLLSLFGGKATAARHEEDYRVVEAGDCCPMSSCYECSCNPLYCGAIDLQLQGGVDPIVWRKPDNWRASYSNLAPDSSLVNIAEGPRFSHFFRVPWVVGGQVGYAWSDNTRVYVEFNYVQARAKNDISLTALAAASGALPFSSFALTNVSKYKLFDGYVGARYYWDRWCDRMSFFLGGKVGFTHHKGIHFDGSVINNAITDTFTHASYARSSNVVSGGANFGLDFCFCGNWSFVITGEVVASCGPRVNRDLAITPVTGSFLTDVIIGGVHTELRFPVTAGIRYSF